MTALAADPLRETGIAGFGRQLRAGEITAEAVVVAYLARIAALDPRLGAYEFVASESALATARALDSLLAAGTDLGPLMGVPVAIKDIIAVAGMPTRAGSNLDVTDLIGPEGPFVGALRRAGCVILGKAKTIEFAFGGAGGVNAVRGSPWNPWDAKVHRGCGGSSSGSAAAVAAGLCAFAIGSDTGGSVRLPAAFCGLYGLKPTTRLWPTDGVFPLCPTLDTLGPLTRSASDAALVFSAVTGPPVATPSGLRGLHLGRPVNQFLDDLDGDVSAAVEGAFGALGDAGVEMVDVTVPEAGPPENFFHAIVPSEFLATFGRQRLHLDQGALGPDIAKRAADGLDLTADAYLETVRRRDGLRRAAEACMGGFDAWITPTVGIVAPPVSAFDNVDDGLALNARIGRLTRPVNLYGFCAATIPVRNSASSLPVGLQVMAPAGADRRLLAMTMAMEAVLGGAGAPDLGGFLQ